MRVPEGLHDTSDPGVGGQPGCLVPQQQDSLVSDFDEHSVPGKPGIAELVADPEAHRWARECGWVPGTGHCRNRPCGWNCLFRPQREADASRLLQQRQQRRRAHRRFASRFVRRVVLIFV